MVVQAWDERVLGIRYIVTDDDTTMQVHLKHKIQDMIDNGILHEWPRTEGGICKKCHGKLPIHIHTPDFREDPGHRKRILGKHL